MRDRVTINARTRRLSMVLRRLRIEQGVNASQAARLIGVSPSTISRAESGKRGISRDDLASLLTVYRVRRPLRDALLQLHEDTHHPDLLDRSTLPEAGVRSRTEQQIDEQVAARIARQALLRAERPPRLDVILHEAALRQRVGGGKVMGQQLGYLLEVVAQPTIQIRVIPANAGAHPGMEGPFAIMDYADMPSLVYLENKVAPLYLDEESDIKTFKLAWDGLLAVADSPERSVELIGRIVSGVV